METGTKKKKPLNEVKVPPQKKPATADVQQPVSEQPTQPQLNEKTTLTTPVEKPESPTPDKQTLQPQAKPKPVLTRQRKRAAEFKLTNSIQEIGEAEIAQTVATKPEELQEDVTYSLNPDVQIDKTLFEKYLAEFVESAKKENKMNLISAFQNPEYTLTHNHWVLEVENEIIRNVVEREKESLLPFLRRNLSVPDLYLEMKIQSNFKRPDEKIPYTEEEKLAVMAEQNPALKRFQEIFKTRIIYQ